jgi:hypothetical protein
LERGSESVRSVSGAIEAMDQRLSVAQKEQFVRGGFIRIDRAFSRDIAAEATSILWRDTGCDPHDRSTWIHPVIRLGDYAQEPFREAANTRVLHNAFDELVGRDRWIPRTSLGTFPIRFPHPDAPGDTGWHVDASFPPEGGGASFLNWRINVNSRGRALLMLFLFSDVSEKDAPTRIRPGSHLRVARLLADKGEQGMSAVDLGAALAEITGGMHETCAIGEAGTVYLCHPFLAHAAQPHLGDHPRFMAQPPLYPKGAFDFQRAGGALSLVEEAIRLAVM